MNTVKLISSLVYDVISVVVLLFGLALLLGMPTGWAVEQFGVVLTKTVGMLVGCALLYVWYGVTIWLIKKGYIYGTV